MSREINECDDLLALSIERADSRAPLTEEEEALEKHLGECAECRVERAALQLFEVELEDGTELQRDPSRRAALVESVLEQAGARRRSESERTENAPNALSAPSTGRATTPVFVAGVVVGALAASLLVVMYVLWSPSEEGLGDDRTTVFTQDRTIPQPSKVARPRVLATSGEPLRDGERVTPGTIIVVGETIATDGGALQLELDAESRIAVSEEAVVSLDVFDEREIKLRLRSGQLVGNVAPGRKGPLLRVATEEGDVVVRGTVFSVQKTAEHVAVKVLRGTVEFEHSADDRRTSIAARRKAIIGPIPDGMVAQTALEEIHENLRLLPLTLEEESQLWTQSQSLEVFEVGRDSMLSLTSSPGGARISIDNRFVGRTPLAAALRPGHYRVQASTDETTAREAVDLGMDETIERHFTFDHDGTDRATPDQETAHTAGPVAAVVGSDSAESLLRQAQAFRARRDFAGAARAYRRLLKANVDSPQAIASMVSLGTIELEHLGRPQKALQSFEAYLFVSNSGPLAQEALYGKSRALRRLGRHEAERQTLESFLQRFPKGLQSASVRQRLSEISLPPQQSEGSPQ